MSRVPPPGEKNLEGLEIRPGDIEVSKTNRRFASEDIMKTIFLLIAIAVAALTACGGGGGADEPAGSPGAASPAPVAATKTFSFTTGN